MDRRNLIPVHVELQCRPLRVHWLDVAGLPVPRLITHERLRELVLANPQRLRATTFRPTEATALASASRAVGLLFHLSRCGSTLAARLLATAEDVTVLVEPELLNTILLDPALAGHERRALLVLVLEAAAMLDGRPRGLLKLTSWNALFLPELRAALPAGPAAFLFRDPVEVLASLERRPPPWLERDGETGTSLAGPLLALRGLLALQGVTATGEPALAEAAGLLRWIAGAALAEPASAMPIIAYPALPTAIWTHLVPHLLGRAATASEVTAMRVLAGSDAKRPALTFVADTAAKRRDASSQARARADDLEDVHARLRARAAVTAEPRP